MARMAHLAFRSPDTPGSVFNLGCPFESSLVSHPPLRERLPQTIITQQAAPSPPECDQAIICDTQSSTCMSEAARHDAQRFAPASCEDEVERR